MTDAERNLLLFIAERMETILHNSRWPDAAELLHLKRLAVVEELRGEKGK